VHAADTKPTVKANPAIRTADIATIPSNKRLSNDAPVDDSVAPFAN
jgi:hypothetical protein